MLENCEKIVILCFLFIGFMINWIWKSCWCLMCFLINLGIILSFLYWIKLFKVLINCLMIFGWRMNIILFSRWLFGVWWKLFMILRILGIMDWFLIIICILFFWFVGMLIWWCIVFCWKCWNISCINIILCWRILLSVYCVRSEKLWKLNVSWINIFRWYMFMIRLVKSLMVLFLVW